MTPNELLLWLSARKDGSWRQFRTAVETLESTGNADGEEQAEAIGLHLRVRLNLERLAHVEFAPDSGKDWQVVPPVIALSQHGNRATGVLCGARTPKLLERAARTVGDLQWDRHQEVNCPDIVRVHGATSATLVDFARRAAILCQCDAPAALLSQLPPATSLANFRRESLPASGSEWNVQHFEIGRRTAKWRGVTLQEANVPGAQGLYRFTRYQIPQYYLRDGRETIALPGAVGKYSIISRRQRRVLKYCRQERTLTVPAIFRPPLLTERALILCSGFLPSVSIVHGRPTLAYRDIPEEIAGIAAETLGQGL